MDNSWRPAATIQTMSSPRLVLRALQRRDYDAWMHLRWVNAQWLKPWDPTDPTGQAPSTSYRQMLRTQRRAASHGLGYSWVVTLPRTGSGRGVKTDRLIGQVSLSGIQYGAARTASIGYWIDHGHAGQGLTPEAVALVCHHGYETLRLHRLEINVRPENQASLRVVRKLGFRDEGLRERYLHIDGQWRDHRTFALNREDFGTSIFEHTNEQ
ncbi:GNAT family N-acetyltransferase [Glutamicibacter sp. MNS18]|uniref:GNAT family N-acetyltransferase n=1 Tax=Glutamicibacter sp. MNS18 TaxID=2989817 RepID=UPI002235F11F|nr:GNAT family protein [Glutamicibacter sp. MNS18]MCW4464239.1 GNAT family N-acetyltransferase [Glutamicibacter sp. MNS18]